MSNQVLFDPFVSAVDASFWHRLTAAKLDTFKLNDAAVALRASFTPTLPASDAARAAARPLMAVTADALAPGLAAAEGTDLAPPDGLPRSAVVTPGSLVNTNSSEGPLPLPGTLGLSPPLTTGVMSSSSPRL